MAFGPSGQVFTSFQLGVADYLKEPWDYFELLARVERWIGEGNFRFSWGTVQCKGQTATLDGVPLDMSAGVFRLFSLLVQNAGTNLSRDHLLACLGMVQLSSRLVDVYISKIRQTLQDITGQADRILQTCHGKGYFLCR